MALSGLSRPYWRRRHRPRSPGRVSTRGPSGSATGWRYPAATMTGPPRAAKRPICASVWPIGAFRTGEQKDGGVVREVAGVARIDSDEAGSRAPSAWLTTGRGRQASSSGSARRDLEGHDPVFAAAPGGSARSIAAVPGTGITCVADRPATATRHAGSRRVRAQARLFHWSTKRSTGRPGCARYGASNCSICARCTGSPE